MAQVNDAARKTYRYLRLGMVGAVVLLAASVLIEHFNAPNRCWQTSISAYYYTPVRTVFVGVMIAIGLNLIVIKGSLWAEDWCLNIAGFMAPIVAFVPTTDTGGSCWSVPLQTPPTTTPAPGGTVLADWVAANADNNMQALLWVGLFGLVVTAVVTVVTVLRSTKGDDPTSVKDAMDERREMIAGLIAGTVGLAVAAVIINSSSFTKYAHGWSAIAMFFFLGLAAFSNGWDCKNHGRPRYSKIYFVIAVLMGATAAIFATPWDFKLLYIEVMEITLFVAFWLVQSVELWDNTLRNDRKTPAGKPAILEPTPA